MRSHLRKWKLVTIAIDDQTNTPTCFCFGVVFSCSSENKFLFLPCGIKTVLFTNLKTSGLKFYRTISSIYKKISVNTYFREKKEMIERKKMILKNFIIKMVEIFCGPRGKKRFKVGNMK